MKSDYVKIGFKLMQDEAGYPPATIETLWANRLRENKYQILNTPFFATGVSYKDIVIAEEDVSRDNQLSFTRIEEMKGHQTMRSIFFDESVKEDVISKIVNAGCAAEYFKEYKLLAIDIPAAVDINVIRNVLTEYTPEKLDYEESALSPENLMK